MNDTKSNSKSNSKNIDPEFFQSVKGSMKDSGSPKSKSHFLKCKSGNTYLVRFIPNLENPNKTFFHHFSYSFPSSSAGGYVGILSPQTFGEKCPISEAFFKALKSNNPHEMQKANECLKRKEGWLANVYIVDDKTNPKNNGKVKILKFGKQVFKILEEAMGEDVEEFGPKIFEFPEGCNLKIKVVEQSNFPNYTSSRFVAPTEIKGETKESVHKAAYNLEEVYPRKTYDEVAEFLDEHYG